MPTSYKVKYSLLDLLPEQIDGEILELGAGWGGMAFLLAARFPNNQVTAYEGAAIPFAWIWLRQYFFPKKNLMLRWKNFFDDPTPEETSLVFCYLFPGAMLALRDKWEREELSNVTILTHTFSVPGWNPVKTKQVKDLYQTHIYLYEF